MNSLANEAANNNNTVIAITVPSSVAKLENVSTVTATSSNFLPDVDDVIVLNPFFVASWSIRAAKA
jgi:ABC-type transporter Mla subunit MlaD